MRRHRLAAAELLFGAALMLSCESTAPLVLQTNDPMLYLVLSQNGLSSQDTLLTAVLGTTATPARFEYRSAELFEMRRTSDGALFDWRARVPNEFGTRFLPYDGNFGLPSTGSGISLGRRDLAGGQTYSLKVITEGRTIVGSVTIPATPAPVLLTRGGLTIVEWPPAPGAAGYLIGGQLQRDTFLVLGQENVQISSELLISAVDTNWFTYMSDTLVRASGIDGGFGLFGAMSTARVVFSGAAKRP